MTYWDTSAILPLYLEEPTSSFWEATLIEGDAEASSSTLAITEFSFALRHKVLRQALPLKSAEALIAKFTKDHEAGRWRLCPLGADVIASSLRIGEAAGRGDPPVALRSLDGIHLGAARVLKCDTVATGDRRLADAAERVGIRVVFPA